MKNKNHTVERGEWTENGQENHGYVLGFALSGWQTLEVVAVDGQTIILCTFPTQRLIAIQGLAGDGIHILLWNFPFLDGDVYGRKIGTNSSNNLARVLPVTGDAEARLLQLGLVRPTQNRRHKTARPNSVAFKHRHALYRR